jgi:uncharacterized delta-60 repeat protein
MRISHWLHPLAARLSRIPTPRTRQRQTFRPRLEVLEDRFCPSGGLLDPTFGSGGIVHLPNATDNGANAAAVQPDGKVVVAGLAGNYLSVQRLNPDGSLDKTFNKTGSVTINSGAGDFPQAVVLQPDGKILVGGGATTHKGNEEFLVARLNTNGTLDSTFGNKGLWLSPGSVIYQLALRTDASHTTVTGIFASAPGEVLELTPAGALDRSFGSGGVAAIPGLLQDRGLAVSATGEVYVDGYIAPPSGHGTGFLAALTPAGALDHNFGGGAGYVLSPVGNLYSEFTALAVQTVTVGGQSVSRLVVAGDAMDAPGYDQQYLLVAAYTLDGSLDTTFGSGGVFTTAGMAGFYQPFMHSLALEADGSIVLGGTAAYDISSYGSYSPEFLIGHLTPDGTADTSFGPNGTGFATVQDGVSSDLLGLAIDPRNGDIVASGYTYTTTNAARQADILRLTAP